MGRSKSSSTGAATAATSVIVGFDHVVIAVRDDLPVSGLFGADADGSGDACLDMSGDGGPRSLRIGHAAPEDAGAVLRWNQADLLHGLPRLPASQAGQWTPQQLSLERLHAFSVKKGCYPGQEIVARTHFLGQAKRGLVLLEGAEPVPVGHEVLMDGKAAGTVVSAAGHLALAVMPHERGPGTALRAGESVLRERPLLDGLAR